MGITIIQTEDGTGQEPNEEGSQKLVNAAVEYTTQVMKRRLELIREHVMGANTNTFSPKAMRFILDWCVESMTSGHWDAPEAAKPQESTEDTVFENRIKNLLVANEPKKRGEAYGESM